VCSFAPSLARFRSITRARDATMRADDRSFAVTWSIGSAMKLLAMFLSVSLIGAPAARVPTPPSDPSPAEVARAKELFDNGYALFQEGSYDKAIAAFVSAYELSGDNGLLYNIALAHERAGNYDLAMEYLEAYRVHAPPEERDQLAEKMDSFRKRQLNAALAAERASDDEPRSEPSTPRGADEPPLRRDADRKPPKVFGPAAAVLTAVTGTSFAVALGLGLGARARRDDASSKCATGDGGRLCPQTARSSLDSSHKLALGTDIAVGIGCAAALTLVVVLATNAVKRKRYLSEPRTARLPTPAGTGLAWRF
jgi:tetratricopeptide (TPR) repeat protein